MKKTSILKIVIGFFFLFVAFFVFYNTYHYMLTDFVMKYIICGLFLLAGGYCIFEEVRPVILDYREKKEKEKIRKALEEAQRLEKERLEKERLEKERAEKERKEKERREKERIERARVERARMEKERLEKEHAEKEMMAVREREKNIPDQEVIENYTNVLITQEYLAEQYLIHEMMELERLEEEAKEKGES